jgi:hypothetical protein
MFYLGNITKIFPRDFLNIFVMLVAILRMIRVRTRIGKTRPAIATWIIVTIIIIVVFSGILLFYVLVVAPTSPRY